MLLEEKKKFSEISKFLILPYTQNQKLRIQKQQKMNWDKNLKVKEEKKITRFPSFRFCPRSKIKNLEILETVLLLQTLRVVVIQDSERTKMNWEKNLKVKICFSKKKKKILRFLTFWFCSTPIFENLEISESVLLLQVLILVVVT